MPKLPKSLVEMLKKAPKGAEELASAIRAGKAPEKILTTGLSIDEAKDIQRALDQAGIGPYDKRSQFLQQKINRELDKKKLGAIGGAGILGVGMLGGEAAQAAPAPVEDRMAGIDRAMEEYDEEHPGVVSQALDTLDKYTGRPTRAALKAALEVKNPLTAAKESITEDKDVPAQDVARKFLERAEQAGASGLRAPGMEEFPSEVPVGHAVDFLADPTTVMPAGKFGKIKALLGQ